MSRVGAISRLLRGMLAAGMVEMCATAGAQVTFHVTFDDPSELLSTLSSPIESNVLGAGAMWAERLRGNTELWIVVRPDPLIAGVSCRSFTWSYLTTIEGGVDVFETGASTHVRNGYPASSFDPDIVLDINPAFAQDNLWFDPDPFARTDSVESTRIDAVSEFTRALGRALAFDGWINGTNASFPGNARSTFDRLVIFDGSDFAFAGTNAVDAYHAPVPLTFGDPFHVGNEAPRPGTNLLNDVMTGSPLLKGTRYRVSPLDFAILQDSRVPILIPCPCDLTHDGFVDDADFTEFSAAYDTYDCAAPEMPAGCPCDFNASLVVDDDDYLVFVESYARFICPWSD